MRRRQARLISSRTRALPHTAKACGPDIPTLISSLAERFREATVARKPGHRGERGISRKTIARGMPGDPGVTVVTTLVCSILFCMRGCGRYPSARHSPCPLLAEGGMFRTRLARKYAARSRSCVPMSLPATNAKRLRKGAKATTASAEAQRAKAEAIQSSFATRWIASLALAMTKDTVISRASNEPSLEYWIARSSRATMTE